MSDADIERVLFSEQDIAARVRELAAEIDDARNGREILLLGVLTGAYVFLADLARVLAPPVRVAFLSASSYREATWPGELEIRLVGNADLAGRDVLVVEDILDTGRSLAGIHAFLADSGARSIRTVVLLDKPERREIDVSIEHVGFSVPDEFLVGYGLDHAHLHRNLPYVGVLRRAAYAEDA